jgi:hypothetical protein
MCMWFLYRWFVPLNVFRPWIFYASGEFNAVSSLNWAEKEVPAGFPQILQNPGMKVVEKGRNAVLVCEATGEPAPAIAWVRDTVPIDLEVSTGAQLVAFILDPWEQLTISRDTDVKICFAKTEISPFFVLPAGEIG